MTVKEKTESTELQVFNLEKFSIAQLPEFQAKKEEIGAVIALNPIVEIIDNSTYELAKKSRTAVKTLRTGLEKEQADVKRKIKANILDVVDKEYDQLVLDVKKQESDRQTPITTYEAEAELKRQEKARLEQQRIDNIKKELDDYAAEWKTAFNIMSFDSIEKVSADFLESYTSFDTTILQEFESLFPAKVEELTEMLCNKSNSLTTAENARLEKERTDLELKRTKELITSGFSFDGNNYFVSDFKRLDMGTILQLSDSGFNEIINAGKTELARLAKIETDKAEKAEEEKEAIYEIRKKRLEEAGMIYSDEHDSLWIKEDADYILLAEDVSNYSALEFEKTFSEVKTIIQNFKESKPVEPIIMVDGYSTSETLLPETLKGIEVEEQALELIQNIDSSVPENTTVNVCSPLNSGSDEREIAFRNNQEKKLLYPLTPEECFIAPTWDSIIEDFKISGEKSYSAWLKNNYNVPTKIQ